MSRIWVFGDSFSESFGVGMHEQHNWRQRYVDWKGYAPKVFGEIISEQMGLPLTNSALGGVDNNHVFHTFCNIYDRIHKNDIVIIGWTNQERFRLASKNNNWGYFLPNYRKSGLNLSKVLESFEFITEETIDSILLNRSSDIYTNELTNIIRFINRILEKNIVVHWGWDPRIEKTGAFYSGSHNTIAMETNNVVDDPHWSEIGHVSFAELLFKKIKDESQIKFL